MTKRAKIEKYILDVIKEIDPDPNGNLKIYKDKFKKMTDKDFSKFIKDIKEGKTRLVVFMPNFKKNITMNKLFEISEKYGLNLFQRLWLKEDGREYPTEQKNLILELPIRRVKQYLLKKVIIPESDKRVSGITDQVVKPDKGSKVSLVETKILMDKGLEKIVEEAIKIRGGDLKNYNEFKMKLITEGSGRLSDLNLFNKTKSVKVMNALFNSIEIETNAV